MSRRGILPPSSTSGRTATLEIREHTPESGADRLVFEHTSSEFQLVIPGIGITRHPPYTVLDLCLSRDSKTLAAIVANGVWLLDLQTGDARRVYQEPGLARFLPSISWSGDGRFLLCTIQPFRELRVIPVDGGPPHSIRFEAGSFSSMGNDVGLHRAVWSPEGDRFAVTARSRVSQTWLVEEVIPESR